MNYLLLFFLLVLSAMPCYATVYMQKDNYGNITYSDTPMLNSQIVNMPEEGESSSFQVTPQISQNHVNITEESTVEEQSEMAPAPGYTSFAIISPKDQENIQNQPDLKVELKVEPALHKGDKIQLLIDGKFAGDPQTATHIVLGQQDRGTHQLSAIIIDSNQKVLQQTNPITIYVNRVNVNFKPGGSTSSTTTNTNVISRTIKFLFG